MWLSACHFRWFSSTLFLPIIAREYHGSWETGTGRGFDRLAPPEGGSRCARRGRVARSIMGELLRGGKRCEKRVVRGREGAARRDVRGGDGEEGG